MTSHLRRALVLLPTFLALNACAAGDDGESAHAGYEIGTVQEELKKSCGAGKYSSAQGADVSSWQGNFNWSGAGVKFGYARISDGVNYIDKEFEENWAKMKKLGIHRPGASG